MVMSMRRITGPGSDSWARDSLTRPRSGYMPAVWELRGVYRAPITRSVVGLS